MNLALLNAAFAFTLALPASAHAQHAHVHGVAKLEVAVEGSGLSVHLESPLQGLLGFEHAPRNDKERAVVAEMRKKLNEGGKLFAPTTAAQCKLKSVMIEAPTLDAKPASGHEAHGDLDADFQFTCAQPAKLTGVEVRLTDAFPNLRRIDAEVVSGKGQSASRLSSRMQFLSW
jgi:hypothetical protein